MLRDYLPVIGAVIVALITSAVYVRNANRTTQPMSDAQILARQTWWRDNSAALEKRVEELEARVKQLEVEHAEKDKIIARLSLENQRLAAQRGGAL